MRDPECIALLRVALQGTYFTSPVRRSVWSLYRVWRKAGWCPTYAYQAVINILGQVPENIWEALDRVDGWLRQMTPVPTVVTSHKPASFEEWLAMNSSLPN